MDIFVGAVCPRRLCQVECAAGISLFDASSTRQLRVDVQQEQLKSHIGDLYYDFPNYEIFTSIFDRKLCFTLTGTIAVSRIAKDSTGVS